MATPNPAKSEKKQKKRVRDDGEVDESARKHKRSKSEMAKIAESTRLETVDDEAPARSGIIIHPVTCQPGGLLTASHPF